MRRQRSNRVGVVEVSLLDLPDVLWGLRKELADILRAGAADETSGYVRERLLEFAAAFEAGQGATRA